MATKKLVIIGLLGTQLDRGSDPRRWESWRPSVSLCQHDDLLVCRLELLHDRQATAMAEGVAADITGVSPETEVRRHTVEFSDAWDFEEVYGALADFRAQLPFPTRARGIPRAHHHRHARRADLSVPVDGVAPLAGPPRPDVPAVGSRAALARSLHDHRSRPLPV
jgi:hypothetical protein